MARFRIPQIAIAATVTLALVLATAADVYAAPPPPRRVTTEEEDKIAAQEQFAEGQRAFAAGDYRLAAKAFEDAYRRKPHHAPLWNAARSWQRAGEPVRAANLYVKYLREAPAGTPDRDVATHSLAELQTKLAKIVAHSAGPTNLVIDETPADPDGVFVAPGEHIVSGHAGSNVVRKSVKVVEGQVLSVTLENPPPPPPPPKKDDVVDRPNQQGAGSFHLPWTVVAAGGVLTAVGVGVTIWSGLDTNANRREYDQHFNAGDATQAQLDDGRSRQFRTNILIVATSGVALLTGIAAIFVDWGGGSDSPKKGSVRVAPTLGGVVIDGTL